jgi:hypothetical protein
MRLHRFLSFDVRCFLPAVNCIVLLYVALGAGLLVFDIAAGMPPLWIVGERSFLIAYGFLLWLAAKVKEDA